MAWIVTARGSALRSIGKCKSLWSDCRDGAFRTFLFFRYAVEHPELPESKAYLDKCKQERTLIDQRAMLFERLRRVQSQVRAEHASLRQEIDTARQSRTQFFFF